MEEMSMLPGDDLNLSSKEVISDTADTKGRHSGWLWEASCLLICAYIVAVVFGYVGSANRLTTSEIVLVGIMAVGTLLKASPQWLDKLGRVKVGTVEFDLINKVQQEVTRVGGDLEQLRLMLAVTL